MDKILIYNYLDYKDFLTDWFNYQKENKYGFSYRSFARAAKMDSPNYLQRIISRQRNMSEKYLPNLISAMGLSDIESEYFTLLVKIEKTKEDLKREKLTQKLVELRSRQETKVLSKPMLRYLSHWYIPVIRELIILHQTDSPKTLSDTILPKVNLAEIKNAIDFLFAGKFITKTKSGGFKHLSPNLSTGDELVSDIVNSYHRETLNLSSENLTSSKLEDRDISSLILSVSQESFDRIKKEIQVFRKKILTISNEDKKPDRVYHLGFQFVPRSKTIKEED